jgi:hypothetical protein
MICWKNTFKSGHLLKWKIALSYILRRKIIRGDVCIYIYVCVYMCACIYTTHIYIHSELKFFDDTVDVNV